MDTVTIGILLATALAIALLKLSTYFEDRQERF